MNIGLRYIEDGKIEITTETQCCTEVWDWKINHRETPSCTEGLTLKNFREQDYKYYSLLNIVMRFSNTGVRDFRFLQYAFKTS